MAAPQRNSKPVNSPDSSGRCLQRVAVRGSPVFRRSRALRTRVALEACRMPRCLEAGRGRFLPHPTVAARKATKVVVDAACNELSRRFRQRTSDGLGAETLTVLVGRCHGGEHQPWHEMHVQDITDVDRRHAGWGWSMFTREHGGMRLSMRFAAERPTYSSYMGSPHNITYALHHIGCENLCHEESQRRRSGRVPPADGRDSSSYRVYGGRWFNDSQRTCTLLPEGARSTQKPHSDRW